MPAAIALASTSLLAQVLPLGAEFPVNTYTTSAQFFPDVASSADGSFVVVWESFTQDSGTIGVFGQHYDGLGGKVGTEFQANTYTTDAQTEPVVAMDRSGNFVVVWNSHTQDGSFAGIFGQRYGASGSKSGTEFAVNTTTASDQQGPAVAMVPSGDFVVVWCGGYGPTSDVSGQRFNSSGAKLGGEFRVNTYTPYSQNSPAVATDGAGNFVVVWTSETGDGSNDGVFGQRFNASGSKVGSEFQVNTYTTGDQGYPSLAMDRAGNFVVVWQSAAQDGSSTGILGQRFNNAAEKIGTEFPVNAYTTSAQQYPAVALEPDGGFLAVWQSFGQDGNDYGIAAQRFDRSGARRGPEFLVNTFTTGLQSAPRVAQGGSGFVAAWTSSDGDSFGVSARRQRLQPEGVRGDDHGIGTSDLNGVMEPGEAVRIEPLWRNVETASTDVSGNVTSLGFGGPPGPTYALFDGVANYGSISPGSTADCNDGNPNPCYAVQVTTPRPATHWDATLEENLSPGGVQVWKLHLGDSFTDVPRSEPFYKKIETLLHNGITSGCTATEYCPGVTVSRGQMGIFIAKGIAGSGELVPTAGFLNGQPYNCSPGGNSRFSDVSPTDSFCRHVHYLAAQNVTLGCSSLQYCPTQTITRDAMASFIAKAIVAPGGGNAVPLAYSDSGTGRSYSCAVGSPNLHFTDVPVSNAFCKHIHYLWARGIVEGCSPTQYCPGASVLRDAMAKFIANGFKLQLYGP